VSVCVCVCERVAKFNVQMPTVAACYTHVLAREN
jgi:hypothetical protein